jgi:exopolyphosphatase/guanosine-5'-triphosphate,3'-diphosphate pyrophosphatase
MDAIDKLYQQASIYLDLNESQLDLRRLIAWAGQLHEVGRIISYKKLHQHGAYILQHAELPGFSVAEQELLEIWVRNQRKKINKDDLARIDSQPMREKAIWLLCLLRIAVILLRDRRAHPLPFIMIEKRKLSLLFDEGWLDRHSLTRLDLEQEAEYLERLDIKLAFR